MRFAIVWVGFFIVFTTWQKIKLFCSWLIIDDSVIVLFNFVCSCCGFLDHFWRRKPTFHACSCSCVVVSQAVVSTVFLQTAHCYKYKSKRTILKITSQGKFLFYSLVLRNLDVFTKVDLLCKFEKGVLEHCAYSCGLEARFVRKNGELFFD